MKTKNDKLIIRIVCLVVSIGLWLTVMYITNPVLEQTYYNIPVTIKNLSTVENQNLVMMNQDKENITVTVKANGMSDQLNNIKSRDFSASIDVVGLSEGITNVKVDITGPGNIEIASVSPSQIPVNMEGIISKVMDVSVIFDGVHANNYYRDQAVSNPSSVRIRGPRSIINSASLAVATINIDGATNTVLRTVPVAIYDDKDTEIFLSAPTGNVQVSVPIYPTKYLSLKPNVVGTPEDGYELVEVTVRPERVRIAGKQELLDTITELTLEELDITDSINNTLVSRNILDTDGLIFLDLETVPVVNTVVEKIIDKEFTFKQDEIQFINQSENTDLVLGETGEEIVVTLWGTSTMINSLTKSDLILTGDLAETRLGMNTLSLEIVSEFTFNEIILSKETLDLEIIESETNGEIEAPTVED